MNLNLQRQLIIFMSKKNKEIPFESDCYIEE